MRSSSQGRGLVARGMYYLGQITICPSFITKSSLFHLRVSERTARNGCCMYSLITLGSWEAASWRSFGDIYAASVSSVACAARCASLSEERWARLRTSSINWLYFMLSSPSLGTLLPHHPLPL